MSKKVYLMILLGLVIVLISANIIFYPNLPDKIGMHIGTSGDLENYISKKLFIFIPSIAILIVFGISVIKEDIDKTKMLFVSGIVLILNFVTIFMNK